MKMYCSIRGSQAWNSNDTRVAKRMALLVFTDFACWAPISFFSLTAAFGYELISLDDAKVFTIFVLPLNSCANPFLYAIFTKQFKKDCAAICKRLEESAMSRSLSRLSNRHHSISWGSSRRPSALNSFFPDKRLSRSNSISGASAGHLEGTNNMESSGRRSSSNSGFLKRNDEREHMINVPIVMRNPCLCSCISAKSTTSIPSNIICQNNIHMAATGHSRNLMDSDDIIMRHPRGEMALRMEGRGAPVGAGESFLSLLKRKKGIDKIGDGMDSDQEDAVIVHRERLQDHLGVFPLVPLGESPGGARRPRVPRRNSPRASPNRRPAPTAKTTRGTSPSPSTNKGRSMNLNCCNGSPRGTPKSHGPEYTLMRPHSNESHSNSGNNSFEVFENVFRKENSSGGSDSVAEQNLLNNPDNNNHEYINVTEEMITELQRIRNSSSTSESETLPSYDSKESKDVEELSNVRLDPEGSECKEKPTLKIDPLQSSGTKAKGCQCKNPNCTDRGTPHHSPKHRKDTGFLLEPLNTIDGRESWVSGTGRSLSPLVFLPVSQKSLHSKKGHFQKSNSFDCDNRYSVTSSQAVSSASMPLLTAHCSFLDSTLDGAAVGMSDNHPCQSCSSSQRSNLIGQHNNLSDSKLTNESPELFEVKDESECADYSSCHTSPKASSPALSNRSLIVTDSNHSSLFTDSFHDLQQEKFNTNIILNDSVPKVILQGTASMETTEAHI